jgi:hypothetical protein
VYANGLFSLTKIRYPEVVFKIITFEDVILQNLVDFVTRRECQYSGAVIVELRRFHIATRSKDQFIAHLACPRRSTV